MNKKIKNGNEKLGKNEFSIKNKIQHHFVMKSKI